MEWFLIGVITVSYRILIMHLELVSTVSVLLTLIRYTDSSLHATSRVIRAYNSSEWQKWLDMIRIPFRKNVVSR